MVSLTVSKIFSFEDSFESFLEFDQKMDAFTVSYNFKNNKWSMQDTLPYLHSSSIYEVYNYEKACMIQQTKNRKRYINESAYFIHFWWKAIFINWNNSILAASLMNRSHGTNKKILHMWRSNFDPIQWEKLEVTSQVPYAGIIV